MAALPPLSTDLYLAIFPQIAASLHQGTAAMGYTISLFLASYGLAQLIIGPLTDRYGRRLVGVIGVSVFVLAALVCGLSNSLPVMICARILQGAGAASGSVLALAITRDQFEGIQGQRRLADLNAAQAVAPMIAPALGGMVCSVLGWRWNFYLLAVGGVLLVLRFLLGFNESFAGHRRLQSFTPGTVIAQYRQLLAGHRTLFYCLMNASLTAMLLAFLAGSATVFRETNLLSAAQYSLLLGLIALGSVAGSLLAHRMNCGVVTPSWLFALIIIPAVLANGMLLCLAFTGRMYVLLALPLLVIMSLCFGFVMPLLANAVMAPAGEQAGMAAALLGASAMLGGAIGSGLVSLSVGSAAVRMALVMTLASGLAVLQSFIVRDRSHDCAGD
ncbi:MAG: MFS transporter [Acidobacteriota bacterium]|nr:MFS transporter [Acidobacteriota bacterium]